MIRFAIATLLPAALLALAAFAGEPWPLLALLGMTLLVHSLDRLTVGIALPVANLSAARALSVTLGLLHFPLLAVGVLHLSGALGAPPLDRVLAFFAFGMFFGQVSNSNAHELIHAGDRRLRRLGEAIYASLLFGHHASAHRLVHHVHVATADDPNTARAGEGFWRFALRAWAGSFRAGLRAESARHPNRLRHPYLRYLAGAALALAAALWLAGAAGAAALLALAGYAQLQLLLSDYVQHYGLRRRRRPDGKPEAVGPQHSWNAPHWYSAAMMLNAPRHSDHHMRPKASFEALEIDRATMPVLPRSLPVMAAMALVPPLWRRVMDRRLARWQTDGGEAPDFSELSRSAPA